MSRSPGEDHQMQHGEVRGVDARAPDRDSRTLDDIRTQTTARISRQSVQFFLLILVAVAAAVGAVVAVIGPSRLIQSSGRSSGHLIADSCSGILKNQSNLCPQVEPAVRPVGTLL